MPSFRSLFSSITSSGRSDGISSFKGLLGGRLDAFGSTETIAFPKELRSELGNYPYVRFKTQDEAAICLPIPSGVIFSNNATYSSIDLGPIGSLGGAAREVVNRIRGTSEESQETSGIGALVSSIAAKKAGFERASQLASLNAKKVVSPNTNTIFQNNALRTFAFSFKLVARSRDDANNIKLLNELFERAVYPTAEFGGTILNFPSTWKIQFFDGQNENQYFPFIKTCNLTTFNSTYNSSTNLFHEGGEPIEVDIQLQFQELKALTKQDIQERSTNFAEGS